MSHCNTQAQLQEARGTFAHDLAQRDAANENLAAELDECKGQMKGQESSITGTELRPAIPVAELVNTMQCI